MRLATALLGFFVISMGVSAIPIPIFHLHVSDFPLWWTAASTAFAFAAAAVAATLALATAQRELERDHDRDEDKRRAQADLVAAWVENAWMTGSFEGEPSPIVRHVALKMLNTSPLPVMRVIVVVDVVGRRAGTMTAVEGVIRRTLEVLPPSSGPHVLKMTEAEFDDLNAAIRALEKQGFRPAEDAVSLVAEVMFIDTAGRHWYRDREGRLKPIPEAVAKFREIGHL